MTLNRYLRGQGILRSPASQASDSTESIPEPLHKFIDSVFVNGLPRAVRQALMREYPRFEVTVLCVPEADKDIMSILEGTFQSERIKTSMEYSLLSSQPPFLLYPCLQTW